MARSYKPRVHPDLTPEAIDQRWLKRLKRSRPILEAQRERWVRRFG